MNALAKPVSVLIKRFTVMNDSNATYAKYVDDKTLIKEYADWVMVLRSNQLTFCSLMLISRGNAKSVSDLRQAELEAIGPIFAEIERGISSIGSPVRFNYLSLMLTDPYVHFHIFPRFVDTDLDSYWPGLVELTDEKKISEAEMSSRLRLLKGVFN